MLLERLHHLGKVQERATKPIHFVTNDGVNSTVLDGGKQSLQGGSLRVAARVAPVVELVG